MYKYPENKQSLEYKLQAPFEYNEIEWRVQSCGVSSTGKPWALVLAYVQARAIQNRLDHVFGMGGWETEYKEFSHGLICRLRCRVLSRLKDGVLQDDWVSKEDGSDETDIEAFKGGISSALKRVAASGYGIGRYLYYLETAFAECSTQKQDGWQRAQTKDRKTIYWRAPNLPKWALPNKEYKLNKDNRFQEPTNLPIKKQEDLQFDFGNGG